MGRERVSGHEKDLILGEWGFDFGGMGRERNKSKQIKNNIRDTKDEFGGEGEEIDWRLDLELTARSRSSGDPEEVKVEKERRLELELTARGDQRQARTTYELE
ncbi:uncharacterized protein A4U43_C05F8260 [Asparagus officinalis]|uniref:Uncharacterized protein n=1 Tax=Asparagus officinalis TaxID=4686 RepID=A0A5P1EQ68_ASPOF|nr:uncharacterized protein A4U43_C05F8260 [Asparagus officinalis]